MKAGQHLHTLNEDEGSKLPVTDQIYATGHAKILNQGFCLCSSLIEGSENRVVASKEKGKASFSHISCRRADEGELRERCDKLLNMAG